MENNTPLVSICTCVYNGEKTIHRVFESMKKLTYPNIEHIIINDGSTDNTENLVLEYMKEVSFPVKYRKKENGGKHSALNIAWDIAEGFFTVQLDADDEFLPNSISYLVEQYNSIPIETRDSYWCVCGACVTQYGDFVGTKYPDDINSYSWEEAKNQASLVKGEKMCMRRNDYLSKYRFPEIKGISHIPEGLIWAQLNEQYRTFYTNEVTRIYYVDEGNNLCAPVKTRKQIAVNAYFCKYKLIHEDFFGKSLYNLFKYSLYFFVSYKTFRRLNPYLSDLKKHRLLLLLIAPCSYVISLIYRKKKHIK